jgi:hypothetical protein
MEKRFYNVWWSMCVWYEDTDTDSGFAWAENELNAAKRNIDRWFEQWEFVMRQNTGSECIQNTGYTDALTLSGWLSLTYEQARKIIDSSDITWENAQGSEYITTSSSGCLHDNITESCLDCDIPLHFSLDLEFDPIDESDIEDGIERNYHLEYLDKNGKRWQLSSRVDFDEARMDLELEDKFEKPERGKSYIQFVSNDGRVVLQKELGSILNADIKKIFADSNIPS